MLESARAPCDTSAIFCTEAVVFSVGDKSNGSFCLCDPTACLQAAAVSEAVALLRKAALWSPQQAKLVCDDQRQAYETHLEFIEAVEGEVGGTRLVIVQCNHPNFTSDVERFAAWKQALRTGRSKH